MKKITALISSLAMILSFACGAFAEDPLAFFGSGEPLTNYEMTTKFKVTLNKPLDFIKAVSDYLYEDDYYYLDLEDEFTRPDAQRLTESILGTVYTLDIAVDASEDNTSAKCYLALSADAPIEFSDELKLNVGTALKAWSDHDTTEGSEKYDIIIKNPINGKFYTMNMLDLANTPKIAADPAAKTDPGEIITIIKNVMTGNAKISASGNTRTVELDDQAVIDFIVDMYAGLANSDYVKNMRNSMHAAMKLENNEPLVSVSPAELAAMKATLKDLDLFAKDAVKITYVLDEDGKAKEENIKLHFDFNLYDVCEKLGAGDISPITKENSDVDFALEINSVYKTKDVKVTIPELDPKKTVDLMQFLSDNDPYGSEPYTYVPPRFYTRTSAKLVAADKIVYYIDVAVFAENSYHDDDNLIISASSNGEEFILAYHSDYVEETVVKGRFGETTYSVNGVAREAEYPFIKDTEFPYGFWASSDVMKDLFDFTVYSIDINPVHDQDGELVFVTGSAYGYRPNPGYVEENEN